MSNKKPDKIITAFLVFLAAFMLGTCIKSNAESGGMTLSGYIKPEFTYSSSSASAILSGFNVSVEGTQISCLTDSKGYFELKDIPVRASKYSVKISKPGYLTRTILNIPYANNVIMSGENSPIVLWPGEFTNDIAINIADIMEISAAFNTVPSSEKYKSVLDINKDNSINISDVMIAVTHFNKTVSNYPADVVPVVVSQPPVSPTPTKIPSPSPSDVVTGRVTYTLVKVNSPTADQKAAYDAITAAMDKAVWYYNHYTNLVLDIKVYYEPTVATADANFNGPIRFGKKEYMNHITAMHEIAHTFGIGTTNQYKSLIINGVFTGTNATNQLRAITGNQQDVLKGDKTHFWPYGLNYTSEVKSEADLINHCKIVAAIRKDLGI
jgi:hypothetical protein